MQKTILSVGLLISLIAAGCSHVSTVRLQPDAVAVGPGLRPIVGIQADATSFYALFIPIPGVNLDKVVNRMLIVTAKTLGADKIANLQFEIDPDGGIWALRKIGWFRSARASGIAVQVTGSAPDPQADQGPEPSLTPPVSPLPTTPLPASTGR